MRLSRNDFFKRTLFALAAVILFFGLVEAGLRTAGYQRKIVFKDFELPGWLSHLDPVTQGLYKEQLTERGFVNEDIYAYQYDRRFEYILKPERVLIVPHYSYAVLVDKMPRWTLVSGPNGFRTGNKKEDSDQDSTRQLIVLGDSSSFGWGVDYEETYGYVLQEKLNYKSASPFELRNFSLPGFTTYHGRMLLDEFVPVKEGDRILISYGANDSFLALHTDEERMEMRNSVPGKLNAFLDSLRLYQIMESYLMPYKIELATPPAQEKQTRRVPLNRFKENLAAIIGLILEKKAQVMLINICQEEDYAQAAKETARALDVPILDFPHSFTPFLDRVMKGEIRRDKFRVYWETYGVWMQENPLWSLIFPDNCHPNAVGHQLIGEMAYNTIQSMNNN